eukprot:TRINITY_DN15064_c0_g1_i1.p2 TRINITY_DN15064_c0_g1~~TRINITY_DN15064_c0_g1_i1.p2  ORF type:complete len:102 (-),score=14.96 TRINITY_DN15064_c0_g1_i1:2529-2834(-)
MESKTPTPLDLGSQQHTTNYVLTTYKQVEGAKGNIRDLHHVDHQRLVKPTPIQERGGDAFTHNITFYRICKIGAAVAAQFLLYYNEERGLAWGSFTFCLND